MDDIVFTGPWITSSLSFSNGTCVQCAGWRASSYSGYNGNCVEADGCACGIAVRDSKDPDGPVLRFDAHAWRDFASALKAGTIAS